MEEPAARSLVILSDHVEGLRAALREVGGTEGASSSLRRLAGSVARKAEDLGSPEVAQAARAVAEADETEVVGLAEALVDLLSDRGEDSHAPAAHVLVIEDNATMAAALLAYLNAPGRTTTHAESAAQAEAILAEGPVDLVVLDLILPDRDGRDLLVHIRETSATARVPVIVLSAHTGESARAECAALGADDFMAKPPDPKELRAAVSEQLARARALEEARRDPVTGLPDRRAFGEAFSRLANAARRSGSGLTLALVELDHWDEWSDRLGPRACDRFIGAAADEVTRGLPTGHVLGRWGSAELVLAVAHGSAEDVRLPLEQGRRRLEATDPGDATQVGLAMSFSAGITVAENATTLDDMLTSARRALTMAQKRGGGRTLTASECDGAPATAGPPRVLLVEDDRTTAALIEHRLRREGYDVVLHVDGDEAFAAAADGSFDAAILDVKIPGLDGFALLEKLRDTTSFRDVPVLMLTGMGGEDDVVRGLDLGANDYMLKPFSPSELVARVGRLVSRGR